MSRCILVTGACGFTGRHLCHYLRTLPEPLKLVGVDVAGTAAHCDVTENCDLADARAVSAVLEKHAPDGIVHLAGTFGTDQTQLTYQVNILSMSALLEGIKNHCPRAALIAAGSAAEYGLVGPDHQPVLESAPCMPVTPYGLSKLLATQMALHYGRMHGLSVTLFRPFQLIGPGISDRLAPGAFARQIRQVIRDGAGVIQVGNLQSSRDFLDIDDAVRGIWALCEKPAPGEIFNLCSGRPVKMSELLEAMIAATGRPIEVQVDPGRFRGNADVSIIYGCNKKIENHCGWKPEKELTGSVRQLTGKE